MSTSWAERFPLVFQLYSMSAKGTPGNYFEMENVERALTDGEQFFIDLEQMFERLDPVAWQMFKSRTAPYVHKLDEWGYSKQLFERFHEADGYGFLKSDGYQDIRFLPEDTGKPMPDLEARDQGRLVLMEV